jgi:alpha-L-rhamnosidase
MHSAYTLRLCMREFFIDGIKRDRLPWVGDLYLGMLCNAYAFGEKDIVHRSLTALYGDDVNHVDLSGIIDYSLYWVLSLRDYLLYFDDRPYLKRTQERFFDLMASIAARENPDGFLPSESFAWIFIDWAEMDKAGLCAPLQMLYAMALDAASHLAALCERLPQARDFSLKAQALRENCRRQFWSSTLCAYVDSTRNGKQGVHTGRHANFFAILSSTANEEQIPLILKNSLLNDRVAPVGTPFMKAIENRALLRCGQAKKVVGSIRTYWGGMLQEGATTFWEAYDDSATGAAHYSFYGRPFGKSLCHAWSAGPLFLLSGDVFGLSPLEPGWRRFAVSPEPTGLEWACTSVPTPCGNIDVQVEAGTVLVKVPEGTTLQSRAQTGEIRLHSGPCTVTEKSPNP